ncbi:MAG: DNA alkylation repair protein, partial [Rothia sp. (in: high G+C Gram-positive bacteria)]|nr:DNA alkylation repair protein [Rothia sp. (in: high G+C Gram-positive bacteria)]
MNFPALREAFTSASNPANAGPMSAYMRHQFPFLGIKTPQRRELLKPFLAEARAQARTRGIDRDFVDACWQAPEREFQYAALDYLHALRRYLEPEDIDWLRGLVEAKSWWDTIDRLDTMVGEILWRKPDDALILDWAQDANIWVRRVAIDHQRPRKAETNTALLEKIITLNFGSKEFFINKAIGWSLR